MTTLAPYRLCQVDHFHKARLAVFVVRRIQNALAAGVLQAGFHLLPLGRVEHQRDLDVRDQPRSQLVHVGFAVAADEIDVHVENVRAFAFLLLCRVRPGRPNLRRSSRSRIFFEPLALTRSPTIRNEASCT